MSPMNEMATALGKYPFYMFELTHPIILIWIMKGVSFARHIQLQREGTYRLTHIHVPYKIGKGSPQEKQYKRCCCSP